MRTYVFDTEGCTLVDQTGSPKTLDLNQGFLIDDHTAVARVTKHQLQGWLRLGERITRTTNPDALYALAVLYHRESYRFDPLTGHPLEFPQHIPGVTPDATSVFPRIDPAVIGLIKLSDTDQILLAKNALRPKYFSLIAGYVGLGESFEDTMIREAWEETGRRITNLQYLCSQPWPYSGSIMVGFTAVTTDAEAVGKPDGELVDIRWVSKSELQAGRLALPGEGSLAKTLIQQWMDE